MWPFWPWFECAITSYHSIHNVVDRGVLQAMWEELAGQFVHRDQLISANHARLSENALSVSLFGIRTRAYHMSRKYRTVCKRWYNISLGIPPSIRQIICLRLGNQSSLTGSGERHWCGRPPRFRYRGSVINGLGQEGLSAEMVPYAAEVTLPNNNSEFI